MLSYAELSKISSKLILILGGTVKNSVEQFACGAVLRIIQVVTKSVFELISLNVDCPGLQGLQ